MTLRKLAILFVILLFPSVFYLVLTKGKHNFIHLPYYGPTETITKTVEGKEREDTVYHSIPPFKFINQMGDSVSDMDYEGKIYVADFFFATCKDVCLKMSDQLCRVQEKFRNNDTILILSHTVNPDQDSVPVLAAYARKMNADNKKWNFVTGDKKQIYDIARNGYFITAMDGDGGPGDFIHSEKLVLVDKEKHIRGIYDGTSSSEVSNLLEDIDVLLAEYIIHSPNQTEISVQK